jgi:hypothetical protein
MADRSYPNGVHLQQPGTIRYEVRVGARGTEYDTEAEARSAALDLVFNGSVVRLITWADGRCCSLETGSLNSLRWVRFDIFDGFLRRWQKLRVMIRQPSFACNSRRRQSLPECRIS